jgi:hypothetical protein
MQGFARADQLYDLGWNPHSHCRFHRRIRLPYGGGDPRQMFFDAVESLNKSLFETHRLVSSGRCRTVG